MLARCLAASINNSCGRFCYASVMVTYDDSLLPADAELDKLRHLLIKFYLKIFFVNRINEISWLAYCNSVFFVSHALLVC